MCIILKYINILIRIKKKEDAMTTIIGIGVENREDTSKKVQEVLSKFGCNIRTRLGINDYKEYECSYKGLILVDVPKPEDAQEIIENIKIIKNVTVKFMDF